MRKFFIKLNRALYVVIGLVAVLLVGIPLISMSISVEDLPPVTVPNVAVEELKPIALTLPTKNVFDPEGRPWESKVAELGDFGKTTASAPSTEVLGVLRMGDKEGIMTKDGFVAVGSPFAGGHLESIEGDKVQIRTGNGLQQMDINPEKEKRRDALFAQMQ